VKRLTPRVKNFFQTHHVVIVSTIDKDGAIHCSAKGITGLEEKGRIYIIDLYKARTYTNICNNPVISLTAVDEKQFLGFTIKGKAKIVEKQKIKDSLIKKWEDRVLKRISKRVAANVHNQRSRAIHPEAKFPEPEYLILVQVSDIIDLAPSPLKEKIK
jgi:general stress protein 26